MRGLSKYGVITIATAVMVSCLSFDEAYKNYCQKVVCIDGGLGLGGGSSAAGGGGGGSPSGACEQFLCPEVEWSAPQLTSAPSHRASAGLYRGTLRTSVQAESLARFRIWNTVDGQHAVYEFEDGGVRELRRIAAGIPAGYRNNVRGLSFDDSWYSTGYEASHVEAGEVTHRIRTGCHAPDSGQRQAFFDTTWPLSPSEAIIAGGPDMICRWTRDGGLSPILDGRPSRNAYVRSLYRTPSGEYYAAAVILEPDNDTSVILKFDGGMVSSPPHVVKFEHYQEIDGIGDEMFVVGADGWIVRGRSGQPFRDEYQAPFMLNSVSVHSSGSVWAVGMRTTQVVYFDGGSWNRVNLPNVPDDSEIYWDKVKAVTDGLIVTGNEVLADGGFRSVVRAYRLQGH